MRTKDLKAHCKLFGQFGSVRRIIGAVTLILVIGLGAGDVRAAAGPGDPPIYNPTSKSYFQLLKNTSVHAIWPEALKQARGQFFRGVPGRLAVIDSAETHEFVMRNFDVSDPMWIGLRYWCEFRMLEWVGLRPFSPTDPDHFKAWHPQWLRGENYCPPNASGPGAFAVVYYQPTSNQNALWQVVGKGKGFGRLLVEYPTGGE